MTAVRQGPSVPPPTGQPYVLLVENEVEDEALAQRILKKYRIANHVDWAKDGEEALRLLRERLAVTGAEPGLGRPAGETAPAMSRARPLDAPSTGASLMPAAGSASRAQESEASRPAGVRPANGAPPRRETRAPELILLSFDQTRLTALETVARMRALPGMENVPVSILCRTPEQERLVRESPLPRLSSLSKPIGFFKLLECIQRMDMHWFVFSEKP